MDPHEQPVLTQLEIILPDGKVEFRDLDPAKGIFNIGRDPSNDIVLSGPGVAPFHARLDCRQMPFLITRLSAEQGMALQGQPLPPNAPTSMLDGDAVQLGGNTFILLQRQLAGEAGAAGAPLVVPIPPDERDELVVVELENREWAVNVQETVVFEVTIANGGTLVAEFQTSVEGIDPNWVQVYPDQVNLNEGARTTVSVAITPPRLPTTRAGTHPLAIVVTSPTYPGHVSRLNGMLTINPYYAFSVGDLVPRRQTLGWGQESGQVGLEIRNEGNSEAAFMLEAEDDERACRYEFQVGDDDTRLANRAQVRIAPRRSMEAGEGASSVRTIIVPKKRPIFGFRSRMHNYALTVTPQAGGEAARSLPGQLQVKPLIGPWLLALLVLCLAAVVIVIFWPRALGLSAEPNTVALGSPVHLNWAASNISQVDILEGEASAVRPGRPSGEVVVTPSAPGDITYQMEASNLLSRFTPQFLANWLQRLASRFQTTDSQVVKVLTPTPTPLPPPVVDVFTVEPREIVLGQSVDITWKVTGATSVQLASPTGSIDPGQGEVRHKPDATGTFKYTLVATNGNVQTTSTANVEVLPPPTATPTPVAPRIDFFTISQDSVVLGDTNSVTLSWRIEGEATEVVIKGTDIPDYTAAMTGTLEFSPNAAKNYMFVLTAKNGDLVDSRTVQLEVQGPTPTPTTTFTPTPTATSTPTLTPTPTTTPQPTPTVVTFKVEGKDPVDDPSATCPGGQLFRVDRGVEVKLIWDVRNIFEGDKITLKRGGTTVLEGADAKGSLLVAQAQIPSTFYLTVNSSRYAGGSGGSETRTLCVVATAPPAPYDLTGSESGDKPGSLRITWKYDTDQQSYILGFRIYRINYAEGDAQFTIVDEVGPLVRSWTDTEPGLCGTGYYVVALYSSLDPTLPSEETELSNSWYSPPCEE